MEDTPRVLIVEPNPFMAEVQRAILRSFAVTFVAPENLVRAALDDHPALIITEILLRGRDGLQLCREIRQHPTTRAVPIIVFSVLNARSEAEEAGADAFLLKPAERSALVGEVRRLVRCNSAGPGIPPTNPEGHL